jgi:hypothetical protein
MSLSSRRVCGFSLVLLALISFSDCGGSKSPSSTTPVGPPSVTPGPTPTPVAAADPPLSKSCQQIGWGVLTVKCPMETGGFQKDVDEAIRTLQRERSDIFNGNYIDKVGAYYVGLIKILDRQGICAGFDGEELAVKVDNTYNEQYDIQTATGLVRFGPVSYRSTCYPAAFPIQPGPPIPVPAGCSLPSSQTVACGRDGSDGKYYTDVVAGINQVISEHPEIFDPTDLRAEGPYIKNLEAYGTLVAEAVAKKGYCARWDGKELQVKRGSNEFNEQYAITLSLTHVRRDPNMYRSTCYPAAF